MERTTKPLQLESMVDAPGPAAPDDWRRDKQRLEDEIRALRRDLEDVTQERDRAILVIANLRTTLQPMHRALRALFGEIELIAGDDASAPNAGAARPAVSVTPADDARWQSFKNQFPGVPAAIIDALLIHGDMKITHLSKFIKSHYDTTRKAGYKLREAGALTIAGGTLCLRR